MITLRFSKLSSWSDFRSNDIYAHTVFYMENRFLYTFDQLNLGLKLNQNWDDSLK